LLFVLTLTQTMGRPTRSVASSRRARRFVVRAATGDRGSIWPSKTATSSQLASGQRSACGQTLGLGVRANDRTSGLAGSDPGSSERAYVGIRELKSVRANERTSGFASSRACERTSVRRVSHVRIQGPSGRAYVWSCKLTGRNPRGEAEPRRRGSLGRPDRLASADHNPYDKPASPARRAFSRLGRQAVWVTEPFPQKNTPFGSPNPKLEIPH
jgi:hypothetical protein